MKIELNSNIKVYKDNEGDIYIGAKNRSFSIKVYCKDKTPDSLFSIKKNKYLTETSNKFVLKLLPCKLIAKGRDLRRDWEGEFSNHWEEISFRNKKSHFKGRDIYLNGEQKTTIPLVFSIGEKIIFKNKYSHRISVINMRNSTIHRYNNFFSIFKDISHYFRPIATAYPNTTKMVNVKGKEIIFKASK